MKDASTLRTIYQLISSGPDAYPKVFIGWIVDVRDAASAHVLALKAPPLTDGRDKRFTFCSKIYKWDEVAALVRERRPELAHRLPNRSAVPTETFNAPLDTEFAREVLGMTFIAWERTVLDSLDACLMMEEESVRDSGAGTGKKESVPSD
jgi:nucleoside-diphosphate-sugar epimerase